MAGDVEPSHGERDARVVMRFRERDGICENRTVA
jgi:hypothetical protein